MRRKNNKKRMKTKMKKRKKTKEKKREKHNLGWVEFFLNQK